MFLVCLLSTAGGRDGFFPDGAYAQSESLEYHLKAAFLYQFSKFVEWPPQALRTSQSTICIGTVDGGPMAEALQTIEGKETKGRRVAVKRFKTPEDLEFCHILYISPALEARVAEILDRLKGAATLTVSDLHGFARRGGMIGLMTVDHKIRFEINREAAERAHLQLSSHLLRLGRIVSGEQ